MLRLTAITNISKTPHKICNLILIGGKITKIVKTQNHAVQDILIFKFEGFFAKKINKFAKPKL